MTLRIESLFGDENDPLPDDSGDCRIGEAVHDDAAHFEDRLLGGFDTFLLRRGARDLERALGARLLLAAIDQLDDLETGWERVAVVGCIGRVAAGPLSLIERGRLTRIARELVHWLHAQQQLSSPARRRLLRQLLAPEPHAGARARSRTKLAA